MDLYQGFGGRRKRLLGKNRPGSAEWDGYTPGCSAMLGIAGRITLHRSLVIQNLDMVRLVDKAGE